MSTFRLVALGAGAFYFGLWVTSVWAGGALFCLGLLYLDTRRK